MAMSEIVLENEALTSPTKESQERFSLGRRVVAVSAALILLAAAGLKAWPLVTGAAVESQAASIGKLILIQGEALLAIWLISGVGAAWAFRAAILFFAGAAVVNLRSIWLGEGSCGCFGKVEVPPWVSLCTNGALTTSLTCFRTPIIGGMIRNAYESLRSLNAVTLACIVIVAFGGVVAFARSYFLTTVIESSKAVDLGVVEFGEKKEFLIALRNLSRQPVTVLGAKTTCNCIAAKDLPLVIAPHSEKNVRLEITPSSRPTLDVKVYFYSQPALATNVFAIHGSVSDEKPQPSGE